MMETPPLSNRVALIGSVGQLAVFLGIAALVAWLSPINAFEALQTSTRDLVAGLSLGAALTVSIAVLAHCPWRWLAPLRRESREAIAAMVALHPGAMWGVACGAGFSEEVLFRGVLQPALTVPLGAAGGIVVTSVLFGLMHASSRVLVIQSSIFGLLFGWITWWSGGLFAAIVAHILYDFAILFLGVRIVRYGLPARAE